MTRSTSLAAAACAAAAAVFTFAAPAAADPLTDLLCNSGSAQFCPAPPAPQPAPQSAPAPPPAPAPAAQNCHSSYDPCLPIVSDVDCAGGSGNGPVYTGRVRVIGPDEYGLDYDNDGIGCDNS